MEAVRAAGISSQSQRASAACPAITYAEGVGVRVKRVGGLSSEKKEEGVHEHKPWRNERFGEEEGLIWRRDRIGVA